MALELHNPSITHQVLLPQNYISWPSINVLIHVRYFHILALESLMSTVMVAAEVVITDINSRLEKIRGPDEEKELKCIVILRWKVEDLMKVSSDVLGVCYFPLLVINVFLLIFGLIISVRPLVETHGSLNLQTAMNMFEWKCRSRSRVSHTLANVYATRTSGSSRTGVVGAS
ncbi:hypothetical protein J6590_083288 [Homalodisca vitripennis]|nr:hypothetical protein J6590_083288 [Homalodisca vitripennis]